MSDQGEIIFRRTGGLVNIAIVGRVTVGDGQGEVRSDDGIYRRPLTDSELRLLAADALADAARELQGRQSAGPVGAADRYQYDLRATFSGGRVIELRFGEDAPTELHQLQPLAGILAWTAEELKRIWSARVARHRKSDAP